MSRGCLISILSLALAVVVIARQDAERHGWISVSHEGAKMDLTNFCWIPLAIIGVLFVLLVLSSFGRDKMDLDK